MMGKNDRSEVRDRPSTPAWIRVDGGFSMRPCVVLELSGAGVRLLVDEPHTVAGRFNLLLKRDANPGRRCRAKSRQGHEISAEFF
jgi:hypothetical protein